ncbi:MAG: response regulator [Thiolinea sp.]
MIPLILVIDDDVTLNRLVVGQLNRMGYAASGNSPFLEGGPGLQQHDHIWCCWTASCRMHAGAKSCQLVPDYPVIIITAYGSIKEAVAAMQAGVAEYLLKPVNMDELELVIRKTGSA